MSVLEAVRGALAAGLFYDTDVEAYVAEALGIPASRELGREVYAAKGTIRDEARTARLEALLAEGFIPVDEAVLTEGARFRFLNGVTYVGAKVPEYSDSPVEVRVVRHGTRMAFVKKGARVRGFLASAPMLVKPGWEG